MALRFVPPQPEAGFAAARYARLYFPMRRLRFADARFTFAMPLRLLRYHIALIAR